MLNPIDIIKKIPLVFKLHTDRDFFIEWVTTYNHVTEAQVKAIHLITNFNVTHTLSIVGNINNGVSPTLACQQYLLNHPGKGEEILKTFSKLDKI